MVLLRVEEPPHLLHVRNHSSGKIAVHCLALQHKNVWRRHCHAGQGEAVVLVGGSANRVDLSNRRVHAAIGVRHDATHPNLCVKTMEGRNRVTEADHALLVHLVHFLEEIGFEWVF